LSENLLPVRKLSSYNAKFGAKALFWQNFAAKLTFKASIISSVDNLQCLLENCQFLPHLFLYSRRNC